MKQMLRYLNNPKFSGPLLFVLALLLYANTIPNGWTIDDGIVIHNNQSVQRGFAGLPAIFGSDIQKSSTGNEVKAIAGGRYRPLTPAMFAVFSGLLASPAQDAKGRDLTDKQGHVLNNLNEHIIFPHLMHLLNALLYALLCLVLYHLLLLLFREHSQSKLIAFLATLFFTVHPLHTEAVANVKGSDEIVSLLFSLLATRFFVLAVDAHAKPWPRLLAGAGCLLLALLAKENALTFLAVIPLTLWVFRRVPARKLSLYGLPILVTAGLYLSLRAHAVGSLSLIPPDATNMMNNPFLVLREGQQFAPLLPGSDVMVLQHPSLQSIGPMPYGQQLATTLLTWLHYLKLFIVPQPLTYDYYPRQIEVHSFQDPIVWLSVIIHLALVVWAVMNIRRRRLVAYGILFYFLTFSIVSNLFFPIGTNMAERFMFMPSVGLCIAVAGLLDALAERRNPRLIYSCCAIIAMAFGIRTIVRNGDWKDNLTLMQHDLQISTGSAKIKSDYGEVVLNRVAEQTVQAKAESRALTDDEKQDNVELLKTTLPLYKEALDVYPMYGLVWFNLARTTQILGESGSSTPNERLTFLHTAVEAYKLTDTYKPLQYLNEIDTLKSLCYAALGKLYGQQFSNTDKAIEYLYDATAINPSNAYALFLLGTAYDIKGIEDSALYYTTKAYQAEPDNIDYQKNYALICQKIAGRPKVTVSKANETNRLAPHKN